MLTFTLQTNTFKKYLYNTYKPKDHCHFLSNFYFILSHSTPMAIYRIPLLINMYRFQARQGNRKLSFSCSKFSSTTEVNFSKFPYLHTTEFFEKNTNTEVKQNWQWVDFLSCTCYSLILTTKLQFFIKNTVHYTYRNLV